MVRYRHAASGVAVEAEGVELWLARPDPKWAVVTLSVRTLAASLGERRLEGIRLTGNARLLERRWEVSRLQIEHGSSSLLVRGAVVNPVEAPRAELLTTLVLALDEVMPLFPGEHDWRGRLVVSGTLAGDRLPLPFEGKVWLTDAVVRGLRVTDAEAALAIRPDAVEVTGFHGRAGGGTLRGAATYEPLSKRYRGRVELAEVSLPEALTKLGLPAGIAGTVTGRVEASGEAGRAEALSLALDLSGRDLSAAGGERMAEGRLVGRADRGTLTIERLVLLRGQSQAAAQGSVNLASRALALTVTAHVADLARDLWPWPASELGGSVRVSGRLRGTLASPTLSGQVRGERLSFRGLKAFDSVEGPLEGGPSHVSTRGLRLVRARSSATLAGEARGSDLWRGSWQAATVTLKLEGKGRLEDLTEWIPGSAGLGGSFALQLSARGPAANLGGRGTLDARDVRIGQGRLDSVRAALELKGAEVVVPALTARAAGTTLNAEGVIARSGRYRFTLAPARLNLGAVLGRGELTGGGMLRAWGAGDLSRPRLEGELTLVDAAFRNMSLAPGTLRFGLEGNQWRWLLDLDAGLQARGTLPLSLDGPLAADLVATDLDLTPYLRALRRRLPFAFTARADGSARLTAGLPELRDLRGRIELTALRCQAGETPCQLRAPAGIVVEAGAVRFDALDLVGPGLSVSVNGSIRPGARTDLELAGYAPFALVASWVPPVADLKGTPAVRVALAGAPGELRVTGRAELRGVEVKLKPIPLWLAVEAGEVTFANERVEYVVGAGSAAGGRLEGRGASERRGERWHHALDVKLDKARVDRLYDELQLGAAWAAGDLALRGSLEFETGPGLAALKTLAGSLSTTLESGSLSRYPALVRIFGLLGSPAQPFRLPDLAKERMPYRRIHADFVVSQGVMETKNFLLDSEVARVSGVGKVLVAEQTVGFDLGVRPLQVLEGGIRKVPLLGRLLPEQQSLAVVYFTVEGPWMAPETSVAPVKSLSQSVVDLLLFLLRLPDRLLIPE